jgi:hypothetical protein
LITTSGSILTLLYVSFVVLVLPDLAGEKTSIGGFALNALKKLKGARFATPSLSIVDANAIGRGPIAPKRYLCNLGVSMSFGFIVFISFMSYKIN